VTGATGFVMGAVARKLRGRGDSVVALVRSPSRAASLAALGCELVAGDITEPSEAIVELRSCDAVVHGAAIYEIGVTAERRRVMEETNVTGTLRMLDAARSAGTKRIVYVSTIAAFGNTRGAIVAEGHRPTSSPTSAYEDTKRRAHEIALDAARNGAPIVIVQPGQVYGPGDHSAVGANFRALAEGRLRYRAFESLGLNLVHVGDLADASFEPWIAAESASATCLVERSRPSATRIARWRARRGVDCRPWSCHRRWSGSPVGSYQRCAKSSRRPTASPSGRRTRRHAPSLERLRGIWRPECAIRLDPDRLRLDRRVASRCA